MDAKEKITKARANLILDHPFWGSLSLRLKLIEDTNIETMVTNGVVIRYNADFVKSLNMDTLKGVLCHEIMHCCLKHHLRVGNRNRRKWNIAGDYAINPIIKSIKIKLPEGHLDNPDYHNKSADEIYNLLPNDDKDNNRNNNKDNNKNNSKSNDENSSDDPGGCGAVEELRNSDGSPLSQAELSQHEQEWKIAIAQAAQQAKNAGQLPADLARLVEEILQPKVDWKEVLRRFLTTTATNDYSWFPPNRRWLHQGLYLPSLRSEELPPIVIAVDTSGSVSNDQINQFAAEISSILQHYHTKCTVIYCDAKVEAIEEFTSDDMPLNLHPIGGGGTDFRPPFEWITENGIHPSCLIYLTDLYCSSFPEQPEYPVLWALIGDNTAEPPFGEVIHIC